MLNHLSAGSQICQITLPIQSFTHNFFTFEFIYYRSLPSGRVILPFAIGMESGESESDDSDDRNKDKRRDNKRGKLLLAPGLKSD